MNEIPMDAAPCRMLPWDSDFFGRRIAAVNAGRLTGDSLRRVDAWCRDQAVDCLYFLDHADDPETSCLAERNGFQLVEIRLTYERAIPVPARPVPATDPPPRVIVRPAEPADLPELGRMAATGFSTTRYCLDARFPRERVAAFYRTWITECVRGKTDFVLVAECNGQAAGYIAGIVRPESRLGVFELANVDAMSRRQGIGAALFNGAFDWYARADVDRVTAATQAANAPTRRLFDLLGFVPLSRGRYYHKWYSSPCEAL